MHKNYLLMALAGVFLFVSSCVSSQFSSLQYAVDTSNYTAVGELNTRVVVLEFVGIAGGANLFNITARASDERVKAAIQTEINSAGATAARDIKLVHKATFGNILVNFITFGIVAPSVVEISGTIITEAPE